jgi:hypothetical protein
VGSWRGGGRSSAAAELPRRGASRLQRGGVAGNARLGAQGVGLGDVLARGAAGGWAAGREHRAARVHGKQGEEREG